MYNLDQLNQDLSMIVRRAGHRKQEGFFVKGVYKDDTIKIVDRYIDPAGPEIYLRYNGEYTRLGKPFDTQCWAGSRILSLAVALEESEQ